MERPTKMHVVALKIIMIYLHDTLDLRILYKHEGTKNLQLMGWTESHYACDGDDRKNHCKARF